MSDGKGDDKVSSSGSCPPSAEDLTAPVERAKRIEMRVERAKRMETRVERAKRMEMRIERAKRMGRIESSSCCPHSAEDLTAPDEGAKRSETSVERTKRMGRIESSIQRRMPGSVRERKRERERAERMRWIEELVSNSHLKNNSERVPMAVGEDEKLKDPLIHPLFRLGLGDEDHHGESMKLEVPIKMEGEDEDQHGESPRLEAQMKTEGKERVFVVLGGEVWESEEPKPKSPPTRMEMEEGKVDVWRMMEPEEPELEEMEPDDMPHWMTVSRYRIHWEERWSGYYGSFEDTTRIPPMRFTDKAKAVLDVLYAQKETLQVYSVKLAATRGSLRLPLDVFGMVAVRDPIDHNRNIIFQRKRDECQTLTEKDPYLVLVGPTRAVMFSDARSNPVIIEVDLKVKGATESEDVYLSFLVSPLTCSGMLFSHVFSSAYTSKLSRLEFMLGRIVFSVEATIFVRVIDGSWPDGLRGLFTATIVFSDQNITECSPGVDHERIILLDSRCQEVVAGDGKIKLSRNVISTESCGKVIFQVKALEGDVRVVEKDIIFHPLEANKSTSELGIGFCKMEVTVFWSRVSYNP